MKLIGSIPHDTCKISLYGWNSKFIVKIELGSFEQTYKVSELDVASEEDVRDMVNDSFLEKVMHRFEAMRADWELAMENVED